MAKATAGDPVRRATRVGIDAARREIIDPPYERSEEFAMNLGSGYKVKSA